MKMKLKMRKSLKILLVAISCFSIVGVAPVNAANVTVKFTVFPAITASMGVYVADAMGYFEKNGITIQYVNAATGTSALQTLLAGSTDFIISDITGTANAIKAGADIGFVSGQFQYFHGALYCQKEISAAGGWPSNMKNLVGKKIGITGVGAATDSYTRYSLIKAGVDPKNVSIIPIGGAPSLVAAFLAKSVDCVTAFQPMQAQLKDASVMVNWESGEGPREFRNYSFNGIVTSKSYAKRNQKTTRAVAQAMKEASIYASNERNAGAISEKVLKFFPGLSLADMKTILEATAKTHSHAISGANIVNAQRVYRTVVGPWPIEKNSSLIVPGVRNIILK
jgi:NitT/TauT family transport system substrate-binding protein